VVEATDLKLGGKIVMAKEPNSQITVAEAPSKRALQRQIGKTRESLTDTVEEIKETAQQATASVKETVAGVVDYREQFQKEPLVWSLGALSAGFALGYTVGYAHKAAKKGRPSKATQFADRMVDELATIGKSLVIPGLNTKIREFFDLDFSDLLDSMRGKQMKSRKQTSRRKSRPHKPTSTKRRNRSRNKSRR
jgi:hypothetical protein